MSEVSVEEAKQLCCLVMPISAIDGCSENHWSDILKILTEAIEDAGFTANLVSNSDDIGIIHRRIIQNLYDNPIVVCDVSGRNPNVMFELGLRLAFDKPTIIVKDDKTNYNFDTSPIEHLEYPRNLRFPKMVEFKSKLRDKIVATHRKATTDPNYTTFLKHFGSFTVAKIDKKEVEGYEFIAEELRGLRHVVEQSDIGRRNRSPVVPSRDRPGRASLCMGDASEKEISYIHSEFKAKFPQINSMTVQEVGENHKHLIVRYDESSNLTNDAMRSALRDIRKRPRNGASLTVS